MAYRPFTDTIGIGSQQPEVAPELIEIDDVESLPVEIVDDDDGGATITYNEPEESTQEIPPDLPFDANLALYIKEKELSAMGADIRQMIVDDIQSNSDWREMFNNGLKFLGFKPEDRDWVFKGASGAWDTKLLEAFIRLHSEIFPELFPAGGPADCKIIGEELPQTVDQAERVSAWTNYYLTKVAREYYDDSDQMLNYAIMAGSAFRKQYICPVQRRPVAKYLTPNNVAMSYNASSIYDAERFTHIDDVTPRNMQLLQMDGFYRKIDLPQGENHSDDISREDTDMAAGLENVQPDYMRPYGIYEVMLDYNVPNFEHPDGLPLPYKITIDQVSGDVLRIERNWKMMRAHKEGVYERKLNTAHWKFMPGFGPFGIGIIHCLGGPAESRTKIKRMLHDSGVFSNFPPTIRVKGMRMEHNTAGLKPGENMEIDTGGLPINNAIQQMAVREPSQMLKVIHDDDGVAADRIIGNTEIAVGDGRQDAPVGTTIALLQAARKPQNGVMGRMHRALTHELENFFELFGEWLPDTPYPFPVAGGMKAIMKQDFSPTMMLTPVSDPNVMSSTERMLRAESVMKVVQQLSPTAAPYQVEAARRYFAAIKVDNVEKLLPPPVPVPQPKDPITENQDAMTGKPLQAFIGQNHDAHMMVHEPLAEGNPAMQAHISEHRAMKYRLMIENTLGFPIPPQGAPVSPEIQERIAMLGAAATQKFIEEQKAKNPPPPSMEEIMILDIKQKAEKERLRHQENLIDNETDIKIQEMKSDDAAALRSVKLEEIKLKTVADLVKAKSPKKND